MGTIYLRHGNFHVVLNADVLGEMPRTNLRKLLRLARTESRNDAALQELGDILQAKVASAVAAHEKSKDERTAGWKYVDKRSRTKAAIAALQENNRLQNSVKRTKADMVSAEAMLKIFNER